MKRLIVSMLLTVLLLSGCQTSPQSYSETQFLLDTVCTIQAGGPDAKGRGTGRIFPDPRSLRRGGFLQRYIHGCGF